MVSFCGATVTTIPPWVTGCAWVSAQKIDSSTAPTGNHRGIPGPLAVSMKCTVLRIDPGRFGQDFLSARLIAGREKDHPGMREDVRILRFTGQHLRCDLR